MPPPAMDLPARSSRASPTPAPSSRPFAPPARAREDTLSARKGSGRGESSPPSSQSGAREAGGCPSQLALPEAAEMAGADAAACACSSAALAELRDQNARLSALNSVLLANISSLYKTAKEEVKRRDDMLAEKDAAIAQLRQELRTLKEGPPLTQRAGQWK
ncbi:hypothetical protein BESB_014610 [Besnoitia besnoiti]|uniref:Uncharacterized protein n=1 Tax=Besnoitia besnoiti TaxID=94643 RepID=A0A2A9M2Y5_BESBE|nr:hypothetical protein BESB_014610 [Besnoitia besnoiti]PFH32848.1 hypothetical protein BESB_014610 [Besnoitia besnoiti]